MKIHIEIGNDTIMEKCQPHIEETDDILWRAAQSFSIDGNASEVGVTLSDTKKNQVHAFTVECNADEIGSRAGQLFFQLMKNIQLYGIDLDDIGCIIGLCGSGTCETLIVINNMDELCTL